MMVLGYFMQLGREAGSQGALMHEDTGKFSAFWQNCNRQNLHEGQLRTKLNNAVDDDAIVAF